MTGRLQVWVASGFLLLVAGVAAVAMGQAGGATTAEPDPTASSTGDAGAGATDAAVDDEQKTDGGVAASDASDEITDPNAAAQAKNKIAISTEPPLNGVTGGTLGFPGNGLPNGVAALKLQSEAGKNINFEVLAQIGQLVLTDGLSLDVVAEQVTTSVPSVAYAPATVQPSPPDIVRPLPKLTDTSLTSAGFRFRWGTHGASEEEKRETSAKVSHCLTKATLKLQPAADGGAPEPDECQTEYGIDTTKPPTEDERIEAFASSVEDRLATFSVTLGGRFLYRSESISGNAPGAAGEGILQLSLGSTALFGSGAVLWLRESQTDDGKLVARSEKVIEGRGTVGIYHRFRKAVGGVQVAPRIGASFSYAHNWWTNPFAADGTNPDIEGYQLEASLFASGHFSGGFSGMVQMGMRLPYGVGSDPVLVFSIIPSLGSDMGGE